MAVEAKTTKSILISPINIKIVRDQVQTHLTDHDYLEHKPKRQKKSKTEFKITELKAIYNCKTCGYRTLNRELMNKHSCKKASTIHKCPKCYYTTKQEKSLRLHMHMHTNGTIKCTECSYWAKDINGLMKHYDMIKDLRCLCGYSTHVRKNMIAHKETHRLENPLTLI